MKRPKNNGFTLIELLVVIAILALLLSVILPALNSAKLAARKVVCAAKMKQWALAEMAYTYDNNESVTPYADTLNAATGGVLNPETLYFKRLKAYMDVDDDQVWSTEDDIRRCPAGKRSFDKEGSWIGVFYGYFYHPNGPFVYLNRLEDGELKKGRYGPFKVTKIKSPSHYMMMLDVQRNVVFNPFEWPWTCDYDKDGMIDSMVTYMDARPYNGARPKVHRGGCNVSLFDGHVEWIAYEDLWDYDGGYPTHQYWYSGATPLKF